MLKPRFLVLLFALLVAGAAGAYAQSSQPSATVVGQEACATCHEDLAKQFNRSAHGALAPFESEGQPARCEGCHGPGSAHADGGDTSAIISFKDLDGRAAAEACLTCHRRDHAVEWAGSAHAMSGVGCLSCHTIHQSRDVTATLPAGANRAAGYAAGVMRAERMATSHSTAPARKGSLAKPQAELCFDCHKEQRAQFASSSHHPVREGLMTCSSCHDTHGRGTGMLRTTERVNELCTTCHSKQAGPFVFEHAPVEESCLTCHNPHGTVANNLLTQNEPFLCLQCHEMHFHNARIAPSGPASLAAASSTNPNGATGFMAAFNTRCSNCHNRVHGSDLPSQGTTGRGKALTR
jgi:predicted CXXCH cytochrome family protein